MPPPAAAQRRRSSGTKAATASKKRINVSAKRFVTHRVAQDIHKHYEVGDLIGQGGFGQVFIGTHRSTGSQRAIKLIPKEKYNQAANDAIRREFEVVKDLDHPNIVKQYELFEDAKHFYIVTDLYRGGELFDELEQEGKIAEAQAAELMTNLLGCLNYIHGMRIVHRDLKPENILLDDDRRMGDMKIIDFGLAAVVDPAGEPLTQMVGTPYYLSPQVIQEQPYTTKADIWACGVICFTILCGYCPFDGDSFEQITQEVILGNVDFDDPAWNNVSRDAQDFCNYLLAYDEADRPTAKQALAHTWLVSSREHVRTSFHTNTRNSEMATSALSNLQLFNAESSRLKKATLALMSSQLLTKEDREEIDSVFRVLDEDCSGTLTPDEVQKGFREFYGKELSSQEVKELFAKVNLSGTGEIEYSEFVIASMMEKNILDKAKLRAAFDQFDLDHSGSISIDELKQVLGGAAGEDDADLDEMMAQIDINGDGEIDFEEFCDMMEFTADSYMNDNGTNVSLAMSFANLGASIAKLGGLGGLGMGSDDECDDDEDEDDNDGQFNMFGFKAAPAALARPAPSAKAAPARIARGKPAAAAQAPVVKPKRNSFWDSVLYDSDDSSYSETEVDVSTSEAQEADDEVTETPFELEFEEEEELLPQQHMDDNTSPTHDFSFSSEEGDEPGQQQQTSPQPPAQRQSLMWNPKNIDRPPKEDPKATTAPSRAATKRPPFMSIPKNVDRRPKHATTTPPTTTRGKALEQTSPPAPTSSKRASSTLNSKNVDLPPPKDKEQRSQSAAAVTAAFRVTSTASSTPPNRSSKLAWNARNLDLSASGALNTSSHHQREEAGETQQKPEVVPAVEPSEVSVSETAQCLDVSESEPCEQPTMSTAASVRKTWREAKPRVVAEREKVALSLSAHDAVKRKNDELRSSKRLVSGGLSSRMLVFEKHGGGGIPRGSLTNRKYVVIKGSGEPSETEVDVSEQPTADDAPKKTKQWQSFSRPAPVEKPNDADPSESYYGDVSEQPPANDAPKRRQWKSFVRTVRDIPEPSDTEIDVSEQPPTNDSPQRRQWKSFSRPPAPEMCGRVPTETSEDVPENRTAKALYRSGRKCVTNGLSSRMSVFEKHGNGEAAKPTWALNLSFEKDPPAPKKKNSRESTAKKDSDVAKPPEAAAATATADDTKPRRKGRPFKTTWNFNKSFEKDPTPPSDKTSEAKEAAVDGDLEPPAASFMGRETVNVRLSAKESVLKKNSDLNRNRILVKGGLSSRKSVFENQQQQQQQAAPEGIKKVMHGIMVTQ